MPDEPHPKNPQPLSLATAPRCGARAKRTGQPCKAPAMENGRCRLHGGKSTGPKTPEGLAYSRRARLVHGRYSKDVIDEKERISLLLQGFGNFLKET